MRGRGERVATALLLVAAAVAGAAAQSPPDGYFKVENREKGYLLFCPRTYKEIPTQPGDDVVVGRFVRREAAPRGRSARARRPTSPSATEIWIVSIPKPKPGEQQGATFEEFVRARLKGWRIASVEERRKADRASREYALEVRRKDPGNPAGFTVLRTGMARMVELEDRTLGFVGMCPAQDFRGRRKGFLRAAGSLRPVEISTEAADLERHYAMHPEFRGGDFRIERRRRLPRGWKAIDTPNYLILHHSRDTRLLARIENDLEAMRAFYEEIFPPARPVRAVSVVRVCRDRKEYLDYGGATGSAGYWNFALGELVLYDNVAGRQGSRFGNRDSLIVLYHEAFHQYIQYSAGEIAPHTWFNEGYGDYFSGAVVYAHSHKIKEIRSNPWRAPTIHKAVVEGRAVPLAKLLHADKGEYYRRGRLYYAEGWSFIYFLNESKAARRRPDWQKITPVYFETLQQSYAAELLRLGPQPTPAQKKEAGKAARDRALAAALEGVDVTELEAAWKRYVERVLH